MSRMSADEALQRLVDGRLAGVVYILSRERVHPLEVPFTQAIKAVSRWGSDSKDLVAAMQ